MVVKRQLITVEKLCHRLRACTFAAVTITEWIRPYLCFLTSSFSSPQQCELLIGFDESCHGHAAPAPVIDPEIPP